MFAVYMAILIVAARLYKGVKDTLLERKNREDAKRNGKSFWLDRNMIPHHIENDSPFFISYDSKTGDDWEIDPYSGRRVKNLSFEKRISIDEKERQIAIKNNCEYYPFEGRKDHSNDYINGRGYHYKSVRTGEEYVVRKWYGVLWLINIRTRMADDWDKEDIADQIAKGYQLPKYVNEGGKKNGRFTTVSPTDEYIKELKQQYNNKHFELDDCYQYPLRLTSDKRTH